MAFLDNLVVNLKATGPAAVLVAWILSIGAVGVFGSGTTANMALVILGSFGGLLIGAMGRSM